jgi:sugar O-acyltransferase (sialic acid O-acetyltransferase NeuD family)
LTEQLVRHFAETGFGQAAGVFDDFRAVGSEFCGQQVLGGMGEIGRFFAEEACDSVAIAVGYKHRGFRRELFTSIQKANVPTCTFVHPRSFTAESAAVGAGSTVLAGCVIDVGCSIEANVLLFSGCVVSHDVRIGAHTICGPGVVIAGNASVGQCCFLGAGTTVIDGVTIGDNVQSAAGAVITKDVESNVLVAGVPAVKKRQMPCE